MPFPQAIVTDPANGGQKNNGSFTWSLTDIAHTSSMVIVGYSPGAADIYAGSEKQSGTYTDANVHHPGSNTLCYTRPKYRKQAGGAWYVTNSTITSFTSTQRV